MLRIFTIGFPPEDSSFLLKKRLKSPANITFYYDNAQIVLTKYLDFVLFLIALFQY